MQIKNRVKALEHHKGADLRTHPKNPRLHPDAQIKALGGVLEQVGIADALLVYRAGDGVLTIIDGHCRGENWQDVKWPCLVLDVTDAEAELVLATHDPLTGMAIVDADKMQRLLDSVEIECAELLEALRGEQAEGEDKEADTSQQLGDLEYRVIIICDNSDHQARLIEELEKEGLQCQALIS
jgi:hypothetical protein